MLIGAMIWLIVLVVAFIERANFIKLLANQSNKIQLQDRLKDTSLNKVEISNKQSSKNNIDSSTITKEKIDVNSATEDELLKLGITIIDAKKAIAYREENDGFKSTNEFFEVINAKPHIIARLETLIDISEVKPVEKEKASNGKRRIDL
jgi:DNA uptake protein ComE-like DNA-binding protein